MQFAIRYPDGFAARHHDQVYRWQVIAMSSEAFAYEALDSIASGRVPNAFLGQREPEPRVADVIVTVQDGEPTISRAATAGKYGIELRPGKQPVRALESGSAHRIRL